MATKETLGNDVTYATRRHNAWFAVAGTKNGASLAAYYVIESGMR